MSKNIVVLLIAVTSLALIVVAAPAAAEKESTWLKNFFASEEIADLESKEGSGNDDTMFIEKRPSWVSGRDLSDYYNRFSGKRIIEFKRDVEDQLALIRSMLHQKSQRENKKIRY